MALPHRASSYISSCRIVGRRRVAVSGASSGDTSACVIESCRALAIRRRAAGGSPCGIIESLRLGLLSLSCARQDGKRSEYEKNLESHCLHLSVLSKPTIRPSLLTSVMSSILRGDSEALPSSGRR